MIRPAGFRGAFFGDALDGNGRDDTEQRVRISNQLDIPSAWASRRQVHGGIVITVGESGVAGEGDGLVTESHGLPLAIATADCLPVVIEGDRSVALIHAGWRGVAAGVIGSGLEAMQSLGDTPRRAAIGPSIGPCCFEVGDEVVAAIGGFATKTNAGTQSVDLWSAAAAQLEGLNVWRSDICTFANPAYRSFRRDATSNRQVAVAWVP
jgi:YfiH family protein